MTFKINSNISLNGLGKCSIMNKTYYVALWNYNGPEIYNGPWVVACANNLVRSVDE